MIMTAAVDKYRYTGKDFFSPSMATFGLFYIRYKGVKLKVIACDGAETGWDHVSVSLTNRCPNWNEMVYIKNLFFSEKDTVFQFHPPKSEYVNIHPYCLHLWRPIDLEIPLPPRILV